MENKTTKNKKKGAEEMIKTLRVKRVSYGKEDTPVELREYKSEFSSAVGNKDDWKEFAKQHGYGKVTFVELDVSKTWEQFVFEEVKR